MSCSRVSADQRRWADDLSGHCPVYGPQPAIGSAATVTHANYPDIQYTKSDSYEAGLCSHVNTLANDVPQHFRHHRHYISDISLDIRSSYSPYSQFFKTRHPLQTILCVS